jgi:putative hydrolase of the HAD superfamily
VGAIQEAAATETSPAGRPISVLLFDYGGVVLTDATAEAVSAVESQLGLDPGCLHPAMYQGDLWEQLSVGAIDEDSYWHALADVLGRERELVRQMAATVWFVGPLDEDVVALVRSLRPRYQVALLSNATLSLERQLADLGLDGLFDPVINSARVGRRKPDPDAFRYALDVLGVPAEEVLFIDDKERNTVVAEELGMRTIVFESARQLREALLDAGVRVGVEPP